MFTCRLAVLSGLGLLATCATLPATPTSYYFGGDKTPVESPYGGMFTTIGPGAPTSWFVGTEWSSNGDVLTMRTVHPNDFPGATSLGIWFGIGYGYGDDPGFVFDSTANGNRVETRIALGANSSEWSLYWFDGNGYESAFYFLDNGFYCYTTSESLFVPRNDMTSFHDFTSHIYNGQVSYYFDDELILTGNAYTGPANLMVFGDGSAGSVSGYGSLLVDSMNTIVSAGPAPVPEPTTGALLGMAALVGCLMRRR